MQIALYTIPIQDISSHLDDVNKFLRSNKIVEIDKQLVLNGSTYCWCIFISYIQSNFEKSSSRSKQKIDYLNVLDTDTFKKFAKFRQVRKEIATKYAVAAYIVFTDAELASIAKLTDLSVASLSKITGIGNNKIKKFGTELILGYNKLNNEESRELNT